MWKHLVLLALAAVVAGCGDSSSENDDGVSSKGDAKASYRIAVIPKGTTHEFWKSVHAGAQNAADDLADDDIDVEILWEGPLNENDAEGQIRVMQNFVTKQVDGICLAPLDATALVKYVSESKEADVPVVIFDSGLDSEEDIVSYVATDNYNGGRLAARQLAQALDGKGNVILLRYKQGSESTEQREQGFLDTLKEEFSEITVISSDEYSGTTPESSLSKATLVLNKHKDTVNGVFAVCEPNANGLLKALQETELVGKVKFMAFDPSVPLIDGMTKGTVDGIVLQDPVTMGYEAVMTMVKHLEGEDVEKRVATGEYVATPVNMKEERMHELLEPEQFQE